MKMPTTTSTLMLVVLVMAMTCGTAWGHGMMIDPPMRSTMWRYDFDTPKNYQDNELFCGGFAVQFEQNGGRCGVCGDPYHLADPKPNEAGGTFARGIIVRSYTKGQVIGVEVKITANHLGYFVFKICPNNDVNKPVTQDCLDQHPLTVEGQTGPEKERFYIDPAADVKYVRLQLPEDMTCTQCVIQWTYNTGNSWGCDKDKNCCIGCGPQENFVNCADVEIVADGRPANTPAPPATGGPTTPETGAPTTTAAATDPPTTAAPQETGKSGDCRASGAYANTAGMDEWCQTSCAAGVCPESHCTCS